MVNHIWWKSQEIKSLTPEKYNSDEKALKFFKSVEESNNSKKDRLRNFKSLEVSNNSEEV